MRSFLIMLTVVALCLAVSSVVRAEDGNKGNREARKAKFMERFDENKDGKLDIGASSFEGKAITLLLGR